jgi:UDP-4-amino-4-deoxy-L-arabinose-oxoglutarate aminotransferase
VPVHQTERGRWGNHVYGVRVIDERHDRDRVIEELRGRGIGTNVHFYPVHRHRYYRERYPDVRLPVTEWLGERLLSLPLCSAYTPVDCRRVVSALCEVLETGFE